MVITKVVFTNVEVPVQEEIIALLDANAIVEGFEQTNTTVMAYFNAENFDTVEVQQLLPNYSYTTENIAPQNWNALWESNFEPVIVGDFCAVRANFHPPINSVKNEIIITPKMSFGTGHHATTYQVIQAMEHLPIQNATVCDYGTGTGVLAILAEKLGAKAITAIDNDDWSIENTMENIAVNKCTKIKVVKDTTLGNDIYTIILANINKNVLLDNMHKLASSLAIGGSLILSGILADDESDMRVALQKHHFKIIELTERNNWLCIICSK